MHKIRVEET